MGKIHATSYKKSWRDIGLKNAWFGILQGIIVAGGATKQEVERVYIFQFKTK